MGGDDALCRTDLARGEDLPKLRGRNTEEPRSNLRGGIVSRMSLDLSAVTWIPTDIFDFVILMMMMFY